MYHHELAETRRTGPQTSDQGHHGWCRTPSLPVGFNGWVTPQINKRKAQDQLLVQATLVRQVKAGGGSDEQWRSAATTRRDEYHNPQCWRAAAACRPWRLLGRGGRDSGIATARYAAGGVRDTAWRSLSPHARSLRHIDLGEGDPAPNVGERRSDRRGTSRRIHTGARDARGARGHARSDRMLRSPSLLKAQRRSASPTMGRRMRQACSTRLDASFRVLAAAAGFQRATVIGFTPDGRKNVYCRWQRALGLCMRAIAGHSLDAGAAH